MASDPIPSARAPGSVSVRQFGASGDGHQCDTEAVQGAVDACAAAGGGTVLCPPGVYRIGTIVLKSHVELHVGAGATLLGSSNRGDYSTVHNGPRDIGFSHERVGPEHLIYARDAQNVAITGRGVIDGNGRAFFGPQEPGKSHLSVPGWRPGQLVTFCDCSNVLVRDVEFRDAPYWTIWPHGCDRVRIQGVTIQNNRRAPNADGVNPDCCRNVHISDCHFDTGDDCIAVRSDGYRLGDPQRPCENITVTNCTLITPCCAVRVGYAGDGPIRNCAFSNLVISNSRTGINMLVPRVIHDPSAFRIEHGPAIENIAFSNLIMDTRIALYLWIGPDAAAPGCIRDIRIDNVRATTERACYIGGAADLPVQGVRISNLDLTVRGEVDDRYARSVPYPYPMFDDWTAGGIPHGIYCRYARDLALHDVRVQWGRVRGPWRSAVRMEHVQDIELDGLVAGAPPGREGEPVVDLSHVRGASIRGCRALRGTDTFLRVRGDTSRDITAVGNDLGATRTPFDAVDAVPRDVLWQDHNILP